MIDAEVIRLRRLRRAALLTRALAHTLHARYRGEDAFARSAVAAWSIARLMNGRLCAHPNLSYQRGPGALQTIGDQAEGSSMSVIRHHHDHPRRREANKDRAALEEQLSMAGENVRRGIEHVRKQRDKVQWLERGGRDAAQDRKVLDTAEDSLLLHMSDRDRLLKELEGIA